MGMDTYRALLGAFSFFIARSLADPVHAKSMIVTATAYNSIAAQTDSTPHIGACNKSIISSGIKVVAVSPDLVDQGLGCGTKVKVHGLGEFVVLDKMSHKWKRRIDIHMGKKVGKALAWGQRKVRISW